MAAHELNRGLALLCAPRFGSFWLAGFAPNIGAALRARMVDSL